MIKYLRELGYKYVDSNDDPKNKQFVFVESNIEDDEELSVMGNPRFITTLTFILFLTKFDTIKFKKQIHDLKLRLYEEPLTPSEILAPNEGLAPSDGEVYYLDEIETSQVKEENGYMITLNFIIRGD